MTDSKIKLLKIYIGESDRVYKRPLYEVIVYGARKYGIAGATVYKGIMSYGAKSKMHTLKIFALAEDLPIVIDIIDKEEKIIGFSEVVNKLFDKANCSGIVILQDMDIVKYPKKR